MLDCLKNSVGLRDVCDPTSPFGFYLDDQEGINQEGLLQLRSFEKSTAGKVLDSLVREGINRIRSYAMEKLSKDFSFGRKERYSTGIFDQPGNDPYPTEDKLKGKLIDLSGSDFLGASMISVELFSNSAFSSNIYIYDAYTGALLDTVNISHTGGGIETFEIGKTYEGYKFLFVAYDANNVQSIPTYGHGSLYSLHECNCNTGGQACMSFALNGTTPANAKPYFESLSTGSCGMVLHYEVGCSFDAFLCRQAQELAPALRYAIAVGFWTQTYFGSELNSLTLLPKEVRQMARSEAFAGMNRELGTWVKTISPDRVCFVCEEKVMDSYTSTP